MEKTLIVGGNIDGNVSSCEMKVTEMITGRPNPWVVTKTGIGVNNCTGETIRSEYWGFTEVFGLTVIVLILILSGIASLAIEYSFINKE